MAINRVDLVRRNNPSLSTIDTTSPLTVGNGELAFTADVTGLQTLYDDYKNADMPLCTMSQWGWHTKPVSETKKAYAYSELIETEYDFNGRKVTYPKKKVPGNEDVYDWLRQNPHRLNLCRIGLIEKTANGYDYLTSSRISGISQTLDMYEGVLRSHFLVDGVEANVETLVGGESDTIGFRIHLSKETALSIALEFPYGSHLITGSDWESTDRHKSILNGLTIKRKLDDDSYEVILSKSCEGLVINDKIHRFIIDLSGKTDFDFTVGFNTKKTLSFDEAKTASIEFWKYFWNKTGVIDLHESTEPRAKELERRIVLSQYLMRLNSTGSVPPQETGLTCNSWYGKFHLEMYFWHEAYLPLFGLTEELAKSLDWCVEHLPEARANAAKNGYKGARWPKMVANDAIDSPSPIAPLLVWQQPHIIYMIYLCYMVNKDKDFLKKYSSLIKESAEFMADFAVANEKGEYELLSPVIPVQECHDCTITKNPTFEVEYWNVTLKMATEMITFIGETADPAWNEVAENMIPSPVDHGLYMAHSNCPDTYENFAKDHPSMLMAYGVIDSGRMSEDIMSASIDKVCETWDLKSGWGWDFAVMAMTAVRLGRPDMAIDLILMDSYKNQYVTSGNNRQVSRADLPLYLPGNGSLLLATAMMAAGYIGCDKKTPGFPDDGKWKVEFEGIYPMP